MSNSIYLCTSNKSTKVLFALNIHLVQFYIKSKQVNLSLRQHFFAICRCLVYDNFGSPLFVAKYHPAGYSSEYSAGRRIFGCNNIFAYLAENKALWSKWVTFNTMAYKVVQNTKLGPLYSKSVTHENSKCVDFPSAQVKHTVQNWPFCLSC